MGEAVLREINPHLYEIGHYNGWWPPILWNNGLRSLMEEPSLFGIVSVFLMPFYGLISNPIREKILDLG